MTKSLPLVAYQHSQEQIEAVERDGFVYLPNVLNDEEIETLKQLMSDLEAVPQNLDTHTCPEKGDKFLNKIINNSFNMKSCLPGNHVFPDWVVIFKG